jgi:hypothetical protein
MMQLSTVRRSAGGRPVRLRGMSASMIGLIKCHRSSSTFQIVGIVPLCLAILALPSIKTKGNIGFMTRFEIVS